MRSGNGAYGEVGGLLVLHAQTPMHTGTGTGLGVVDLPVQRERHTRWPVIPASSLKGVLRDTCRRAAGSGDLAAADAAPELQAVFGPAVGKDARENAGALALTDGRLVLFPVRSLRGVFAWITCPAALARLVRDLEVVRKQPWPGGVPPVEGEDAQVTPGCALAIDGSLVLEDLELRIAGEGAANVAAWLSELLPDGEGYGPTRERLRTHLCVVSDDVFTHFAEHATEVVARVGLDYATKTVRKGALFYQEQLPPECVFYALALAGASRRRDVDLAPGAVLGFVKERLPAALQIGGDETIGKGLCGVRLVS